VQLQERYRIIEKLGGEQGKKFGDVFLGEEKASENKVVLKSLGKNSKNESIIERLKQEATFTFKHPGLPQIIELFESAQELILIKSYQKGIPLDEFWKNLPKRNRLPFLKEIIKELIPIFNHLKENNVVHCDIKPSNLLIDKNQDSFKVALIDFGLAHRIGEPTNRKTLFALGYAAPELILNRLDLVDHRTDQFALGILIWKLFTGQLPLVDPNPSIYTNLQLTHPLPDHSSLPKGIFPILSKMCSKHVFRTAPNLLSNDEVERSLKSGMNSRYNDLNQLFDELNAVHDKRNWFGF